MEYKSYLYLILLMVSPILGETKVDDKEYKEKGIFLNIKL